MLLGSLSQFRDRAIPHLCGGSRGAGNRRSRSQLLLRQRMHDHRRGGRVRLPDDQRREFLTPSLPMDLWSLSGPFAACGFPAL